MFVRSVVRLDEVSAIALGYPHDTLARDRGRALGGMKSNRTSEK
ncbi:MULTISPECIES: hypothetical protein [Nocardia]|nr:MULTISPECIES: hypothetical protein [Nocardia]